MCEFMDLNISGHNCILSAEDDGQVLECMAQCNQLTAISLCQSLHNLALS